MNIIGEFSGDNRVVQEAVQNRIFSFFLSKIASSLMLVILTVNY